MPPGNVRGESAWTRRARAAKPEIKLTPGKGAADLTVPLEDILDAVVKQNRVHAASKPGLYDQVYGPGISLILVLRARPTSSDPHCLKRAACGDDLGLLVHWGPCCT